MTRSAARLGACLVICLLLGMVCSRAAAAAVYQVPHEIPDNCAVPVEDEIMAWLATVPDGNTAQFAPGGCYGQDGTITVSGRSNLVIDGQGSEFRALTDGDSRRANWRFVGGTNLGVQNMAVRGSNPEGVYIAGFEWQHGFSVEGVQGMTLAKVEARATWGDGVYLDHGAFSPACGDDASSARDVLITGATLERVGRQGVAVVDAENVTVQDSVIGPVALASVDLETDDDCEIARHVTIARNQFGAHTWGVVDSVGFGAEPQVGDVTVTDNTQSVAAPGCFTPVRILSPVVPEGQPRVYRNGYTFRGNRLLGTRNGFEFRGLRNVEVSSNGVVLPPTVGCGKRAGVLLVDSHTASISSNAFIGANDVFTADALSTDITAEGNWTVDTVAPDTSIGSGPEVSVNSTSATFEFGSDEGWVSFECRLDGGAFEPCSSPKEYEGVSDGPHTFEVRATDIAGNVDGSPASRSWTVDTAAPSVTLDQPTLGATTNDAAPALSGTAGSQPGDSATVTVKLWSGSGAIGLPLQSKATSRDAATGAYSLTADTLADGIYTARAEQSDTAGNNGQSSTTTFTVDATARDTGPPSVTSTVTALLAALPDVTPPTAKLGGKRTQKVGRTIKVEVEATTEDLWVTTSGKLAIRGSKKAYQLRGVKARFIARGHSVTLKLRLSKNALRATTRSLRGPHEARAKVSLSLSDAAGNVTVKKRTIKLER
jgi:Bacterial Ig-like domain